MIRGVHHISFSVSDIERSVRFYERLLGFEPQWRVDDDTSTELRVQAGYPEARVNVAQLSSPGGGLVLELIEYQKGTAGRAGTAAPARRDVGAAHMCLLVDDMEATVRWLQTHGVEFLSEPQYFDDDGGILAVYFLDPDGITVELTQSLNREGETA